MPCHVLCCCARGRSHEVLASAHGLELVLQVPERGRTARVGAAPGFPWDAAAAIAAAAAAAGAGGAHAPGHGALLTGRQEARGGGAAVAGPAQGIPGAAQEDGEAEAEDGAGEGGVKAVTLCGFGAATRALLTTTASFRHRSGPVQIGPEASGGAKRLQDDRI